MGKESFGLAREKWPVHARGVNYGDGEGVSWMANQQEDIQLKVALVEAWQKGDLIGFLGAAVAFLNPGWGPVEDKPDQWRKSAEEIAEKKAETPNS